MRALRIIGTVRDITKNKLREETERKREEDVIHAGRVAMLGEMATTLGHELNQPLTAISAYSGAALRSLDSRRYDVARLKEVLSEINVLSKRAGEIIQRIRDFVRKQPSLRIRIDISNVID